MKLENYPGDNVVLWHTPATPCASGKLDLPSTATSDDKKRFWAIFSGAIIAGHTVFVRYDNQTCQIQSFGMYGE